MILNFLALILSVFVHANETTVDVETINVTMTIHAFGKDFVLVQGRDRSGGRYHQGASNIRFNLRDARVMVLSESHVRLEFETPFVFSVYRRSDQFFLGEKHFRTINLQIDPRFMDDLWGALQSRYFTVKNIHLNMQRLIEASQTQGLDYLLHKDQSGRFLPELYQVEEFGFTVPFHELGLPEGADASGVHLRSVRRNQLDFSSSGSIPVLSYFDGEVSGVFPVPDLHLVSDYLQLLEELEGRRNFLNRMGWLSQVLAIEPSTSYVVSEEVQALAEETGVVVPMIRTCHVVFKP